MTFNISNNLQGILVQQSMTFCLERKAPHALLKALSDKKEPSSFWSQKYLMKFENIFDRLALCFQLLQYQWRGT